MNYIMPKVDLEKLSEILEPEEFAIARRIVAKQGKNKGRLRASKPYVDNKADPLSGKAAYVWRMVAFICSPIGQHNCMPVTADWDLPIRYRAYEDKAQYRADKKQLLDELDALVDKITATMPMSEGALQWSRALGLVR